jgi:predicted negative regulator of RcsB-dependent stress response
MSIDLLQEVQAELKQEKIWNFFRNHSKYIAICVLLLVFAGALGVWWHQHTRDEIHKEYMQIVQMLKSIKDKDALEKVLGKFEQLGKGQTAYSTLANLAIANISDALGNYSKAIYYYGIVANNAKANNGLQSYAHLMKAASSLRSQKVTIDEALHMLENDSGKHHEAAFRRSSTLLRASLLIESGKKEEARAILKTITDSSTNNSDGGAAELLLSLTY